MQIHLYVQSQPHKQCKNSKQLHRDLRMKSWRSKSTHSDLCNTTTVVTEEKTEDVFVVKHWYFALPNGHAFRSGQFNGKL